jgi:hypothetical protein
MVDFESSVINGLAQGAGMVGIFALYLDRRLVAIEAAINRLSVSKLPDFKDVKL